jgi:hypothetical protein
VARAGKAPLPIEISQIAAVVEVEASGLPVLHERLEHVAPPKVGRE